MNDLGIGIIGCGNISTTYLNFIPQFSGLNLRAVADINLQAAQQRATEYGIRAETVDSLLAAEDIDIVVNLTVPSVHFEVTRSILEAGKHAYTEKPLVLTLEEGKILRDLAAEKALRIGSTPDTFLGGAHQQARAAIDAGDIGTVLGGTCHVLSHGMEHWHPNPDFFFKPGGGPILDLGPYYLTNLIQLIGPIRTVCASATSGFATRTISNGPRTGEELDVETPTNIHAILEFESGAIVTLGASWDVWKASHPNMELHGTKGSMSVPDPNFFGGDVTVSNGDDDLTPLAGWDHPFGVGNQAHGDVMQANYRAAGLSDMAHAIMSNRPHRCNMDLALHAVDAMTGILKAGETRTWVDMTTTCERPAPLGPEQARDLMRGARIE